MSPVISGGAGAAATGGGAQASDGGAGEGTVPVGRAALETGEPGSRYQPAVSTACSTNLQSGEGGGGGESSVRKVGSRSKFTGQIFTPQTEQNFQMCTEAVFISRTAEQIM